MLGLRLQLDEPPSPGAAAEERLFVHALLELDAVTRRRQRLSFTIGLLSQGILATALAAALQLRPLPLSPAIDPGNAATLLFVAPAATLPVPAPPLHRRLHALAQPPRPPRVISLPATATAMPSPPASVAGPPAAPVPPAPPPPAVRAPALAPAVRLTNFGVLTPLPPQTSAAPHTGSFPAPAAASPANPSPATVPHAAGFDDHSAGAAAPAAAPSTLALNRFDAAAPAPQLQATPAEPPDPAVTPPRILRWPTPVYPAAAAAHHLEGEVALAVRLRADGSVTVLRVLQGMPDGCNDAAAAAARQLQFQPARRAGVPVDWDAVLYIRFRLAY